jgi:hypothetical protein
MAKQAFRASASMAHYFSYKRYGQDSCDLLLLLSHFSFQARIRRSSRQSAFFGAPIRDLLIKDFTPLGHSNWQTLLSSVRSLPTLLLDKCD